MSISPWTGSINLNKREETLEVLRLSIVDSFASGLAVIVALFADGQGPPSRSFICSESGNSEFRQAVIDILGVLPDRSDAAIELLNEPPSCPEIGRSSSWSIEQLAIYKALRIKKKNITVIISGVSWGSIDGILGLDVGPFVSDQNTLFSFHYYEPLLFTHQGKAWFQPGYYKFVDGVGWPVNAHLEESRWYALGKLSAAESLDSNTSLSAQEWINRQFLDYLRTGTESYLVYRFGQVVDWAKRNRLPASRIIVGEYGVGRDASTMNGSLRVDAPTWITRVRREAERRGFASAVWDLDSSFGVLCQPMGHDGDAEICPSLSKTFR